MIDHEETTMKTHTFGGRGLDRYVFEFETVLDPAAATASGLEGSEVGDPPAAPAAAPVEPPPAVAEEPPAALSRDDVIAAAREAALEGSGEAFRAFVAQAEADERARQASVPVALPEWDPYDRETVMAHTVATLTPLFRMLEQAIIPAAQAAQTFEHQEGERQAITLLDGLKTGDDAIGDFENSRAIERARQIIASGERIAPEDALRRAAAEEVAHDEAVLQAGLKRLGIVAENHLRVAGEVASGAAAAGEVTDLPRGKTAYDVQLERSLANRGIRPGVAVPTG